MLACSPGMAAVVRARPSPVARLNGVQGQRRDLLRRCAALWPLALGSGLLHAQSTAAADALTKKIPATGEPLPAVGLGSWITFNVGNDRAARDSCAEVMRAFFDSGGRLIDSSPMYGSSQGVIGDGLARIGRPGAVFAADKVWISSGASAAVTVNPAAISRRVV